MMPEKFNFSRIAIAANPQSTETLPRAQEVSKFLSSRGVETVYGLLDDPQLRQHVEERNVELLIVLGGDGTMLRAGHLCAPADIPILGINMGHFGFLTEIQRGEWRDVLPRLLTQAVWFENRMMLKAERWQGGELMGTWEVVNEAVVGHGRILRPVHLEASVDGKYLTTYVADGLIVATPTGSTAYALAAGGPILPPELRNILLVPVAPHLSIDRAVVLAEGSAVTITVKASYEAVLSVDGQNPIEVADGDLIKVYASKYNVRFLRLQDPAYFYHNITMYMKRNPAVK
jgi:NAD+ kinase